MIRARRIRPLTDRDLARLPGPIGILDPFVDGTPEPAVSVAAARMSADATPSSMSGGKGWIVDPTWAHEVTRRWGGCGLMALNDGRVIGYLLLAPPDASPESSPPGGPAAPSPDAAVVLTGWVVEEFRGHGIGRQLIQAAAATAVRHSCRALEAFGTQRTTPDRLLPVSWLTAVGFTIDRPHPVTPRLRLDLRRTARRRVDWGVLFSRLAGLVARPAPPEPASYEPARFERPAPSHR